MHSVVFVTTPTADGKNIAEILVKQKLAACVNIVPVRSIYSWKSKIEDDEENLLIIKTKDTMIEKLKKTITEIHPYDVPECIVLPIKDGLPDYLKWIEDTVSE